MKFVEILINTVSVVLCYFQNSYPEEITRKQFEVHTILYKVIILVHRAFTVSVAQFFLNQLRERSVHER